MSYGLNIFNSAGELIASDSLAVNHFLGRATYITGGTRGNAQWQQWRIAGHAGRRPIAFLRTNGSLFAAVDAVKDVGGGTWDIYVLGTATEVLCFSTLPALSAAEPWGLQILDAAGQVTFDVGRKPLNIRWLSTFGPGFFASDVASQTFTVPSLSQPAFFFPTGGVQRVYTWGTFNDTYVESVLTARVSGTAFTFSNPSVFIQNFPHPGEPEPPAPEVLEDNLAPTVVAVIDGAHY